MAAKRKKLTAAQIRAAVKQIDAISVKLNAMTAETERWTTMDADRAPSTTTMERHLARADKLMTKLRALTAISEVSAALIERERT